jgi:hypothetical protein
MNQNFEHHSYSIQSKLGILIFDEMKIKEGLIWSQHNNKLLGFTDIECMQDRGDEELIASNVLQFFFKSLFPEFVYPCTYLYVRNLTGIPMCQESNWYTYVSGI